jgi:aminopeptidase N
MKYFLLLIGAFSFAQQPGPKGTSVAQTRFADFKTAHGTLSVDYAQRSVSGDVTYDLEILKPIDTLKIDAQQMTFSEVKLNGKPVNFKNSGKQLLLISKFRKGKDKLTFHYSATPKQTLYFVSAGADIQVWTQGQGKYTSYWFPSFDDVNEKVTFSLSVTYDADYQVISNGILLGAQRKGSQSMWNYEMHNPMSSYLLMLAIGKFEKTDIKAASGIPLELYTEPGDANKSEATYRYSKQIFDFFEKEIGVPYQWEVYRQIPVRDFLYGGMENTSSTLFTRDYVVDDIGFNDRNYVNVNGHELAHQWFGDLVTAKSGKHHWLQEGFATYYALLAEKEVFGDDYFYWKLYENAESLQQASKTDTIPILNEKASSLSFYQKGAWALHVLRENVGEENFRKAIKAYLEKYKFQNVETDDFLNEIAKVSDYDVKSFKKRWLESSGFEVGEALALLKKNKFMQQYFEIGDLSPTDFAQKQQQLESVLTSNAYFPVKQEAVYQTIDIPFEDKKKLLLTAMQTNDVEVRQAVVQTLKKIPTDFEAGYETFLDDKSYITQELALGTLCKEFPEKRPVYLDKTDGRIGMNDKNIRLLWLTLALTTKDYREDKKAGYYDELISYAGPAEESNVRQDAIEKLLYINKGDTNVLPLLVSATVHHKWQLTKFARDKIRELLKGKNHRAYFEELLPKLPENQKAQLQKLLDEK